MRCCRDHPEDQAPCPSAPVHDHPLPRCESRTTESGARGRAAPPTRSASPLPAHTTHQRPRSNAWCRAPHAQPRRPSRNAAARTSPAWTQTPHWCLVQRPIPVPHDGRPPNAVQGHSGVRPVHGHLSSVQDARCHHRTPWRTRCLADVRPVRCRCAQVVLAQTDAPSSWIQAHARVPLVTTNWVRVRPLPRPTGEHVHCPQ